MKSIVRIAVLAAVILLPWPDCQQHQHRSRRSTVQLAAGQGVPLSGSQLLAASNVDLATFEDSLVLSQEFTGATSRKKRPNRSTFGDALSLAQLQLANYHVASAPAAYTSDNTQLTPGGLNYVPKVRDQGQCGTCVGHAVASVVEAAAGAATRQNAVNWDVSPQSLYYCSEGGRTCATGWDITEALSTVRNSPRLVRPTSCGVSGVSEPDVGDWEGYCNAASTACPYTNPSLPWLTCSYKSLSSFWQIQQHIRNHGAVVTRMVVNDDFKPFFSPSGNPGASYGAYKASNNAQGLYGHAAVIIGYDNVNMTWTMLNSWGNCTAGSCLSPTGVTSDGQFVIKMGQAGVGSPEDTYGVVCEPTAGTDLDPHEVRPWARQQRRKVSLLNPADLTNLAVPCFLYTAVEGDTAASIADAFLLDLRLFVRDNADLFKLVTVNASFGYDNWTAADFQTILDAVESTMLPNAMEPFFTCTRNTTGQVSVCTDSDDEDFADCIGAQSCVLSYSEQNVTISPVGHNLRVCNISNAPGQFDKVAVFQDPKVSQPRALRALLNTLSFGPQTVPVPLEYCSTAAWDTLSGKDQLPPSFVDRWVRACDNDGYVTDLDVSITAAKLEAIAREIDVLLDALMVLERLQRIRIVVQGGTLPKQLGAMASLQIMQVDYWCMKAKLPENYGRGWPNFKSIYVRQYPSAKDDAKLDPDCGLTGGLPAAWGWQMPNLEYLDLSGNALTGNLPAAFSNMTKLKTLLLNANQLNYKIPPDWSKMRSLFRLDLSSNKLEGVVPLPFGGLRETLGFLSLDNNPSLQGCVPLSPFTTLTYENTGITGLCSSTRDEVERIQASAIEVYFPALLNSDRDEDFRKAVAAFVLRSKAALLHEWIAPGQSVAVIPQFVKRGSISMTLRLIEGIVYVTAIRVIGAGLDLRLLPEFVAALPKLDSFTCDFCLYYDLQAASMLPPSLAAKAPASLKTLALTQSKVVGGLPQEWGSWSTLKKLDLANNSLSGPLPSSWMNMSALIDLSVRYNKLAGNLPSSWGQPGILPEKLQLDAAGNVGLNGSVPDTWARFKGYMQFGGTSISGCVPDQLVFSVVLNSGPNTPCSTVSKQTAALRSIKKLVDPTNRMLTSWDTSTLDMPNLPSPGLVAPVYCRNWLGVTCDASNNVIGLDLSNLISKRSSMFSSSQPQQAPAALINLLPHLMDLQDLRVLMLNDNTAMLRDTVIPAGLNKLRKLQILNLSNCGLMGQLPPGLGNMVNLQQLILSGNPNLKGQLPSLYAGMVSLKVLDISGCGFSGSVPADYASLQSLEVFKAGNNVPGLSGSLPDDLGIIESLVQLDISNAKLTGRLPTAWADPFDLSQVAAAAVTRAQAAAAQAAENAVSAAAASGGDATDREAEQEARQAAVAALRRRVAGTAADSNTASAASSGGWLGLMKLEVLSLPGNKLSGALPITYAGMAELRVIDLSNNNFTGGLPVRWASLSLLQKLLLKGNGLSGSLPTYYARLSKLQQLDLAGNNFSGSLPRTWASLSSAVTLSLASNKLSGPLPETWFGMRSATTIDLGNNLLTGNFPAALGVMADRSTHRLTKLVLSENPCMNTVALVKSIGGSGITAGGFVTVDTTCSAACTANKNLCKKKAKVAGSGR